MRERRKKRFNRSVLIVFIKNIAARAGQDSKRVGVGIISVLDKVFSLIVRAVYDKIGKKSKNG